MRITLIFILSMLGASSFAQNNLQNYTPSILFSTGDWEVKSFQNLYTQRENFDGNGDRVSTGGRQNYFTSINQLLYGLNDQINIGFDVWVKHVSTEDAQLSRTAMSGFGPKIKIAPFKSLRRLSLQSTLLFPGAANLESNGINEAYLSDDATLWFNQVFYDLPLNDKMQLFFQQAFWYYVTRDSFRVNNFLKTQTSVFFSYFPSSRWTVYAMSEYFPTHYNAGIQEAVFANSYFIQSGLGTKYQLIPQFIELELLYTNFWKGVGDGAGETINLGVRVIRQK